MKTITSEYKTPGRILYVENYKDSRGMLAFLLENDGYAMSTAISVASGVNLARLEPFDLYILDSRFTDGSGLELCRQIRTFDSVTPIILYSNLAYHADIKAGLAAGAQAYLVKPAGIYAMTQTIAEILNDARKALVLPENQPYEMKI